MASITRGKILRDDVAHWDGVTRTDSRTDATGGTVSGLNFGDEVDVLQVFGSGTDRTLATINSAIGRLGGANATLRISTGTWTIDDDLTIPSNVTLRVPYASVLSISSGKTITFNGSVFADSTSFYTGSGSIVLKANSLVGGKVWYGETSDETTAAVTIYDWSYEEGFVDRYFDTSGTDYSPAIQAALNIYAVSTKNTAIGEVVLPKSADVQMESQVSFDRGSVTIRGWGHDGQTVLTPQSNFGYCFKHTRTSGRSSGLIFRDFSIDGSAATLAQGFHIENTGGLRFDNVNVENCAGGAFFGADLQDPRFDLRQAHCGSEVQTVNLDGTSISETGSISASDTALTLSAAGDWRDNDTIEITGAGTGGANLETVVSTGGGTTSLVVADAAVTTVSGAVIKRIYPSMMIGNTAEESGNPNATSSNSVRFDSKTWIGRYRKYGASFFFVSNIYFTGKVHARTTAQEASPTESTGLKFDRCDDVVVNHSHFEHPRHRAIHHTRSGGSRDCSITITGSTFNSAANYITATDIAFIQCGANTQGIIDENVFRDDLGHSSYTTNGDDILLDASHKGFSGVNRHIGTPGNSRVNNGEAADGQPISVRQNRDQFIEDSWTPVLQGSSVAGDHTYTEQTGFYRIVNRMVHAWFEIVINSAGTPTMSGNMRITGLPIVSANVGDAANLFFGGHLTQVTGLALATDEHIALQMSPNADLCVLRSSDTNGNPKTLDETYLAAGMTLRGKIEYPIDE